MFWALLPVNAYSSKEKFFEMHRVHIVMHRLNTWDDRSAKLMKCPNCDKTVPDSLKECGCGWSFEYNVMFEKQSQTKSAKEHKSSSVKNSSVSEESYSALSIYTSILKGFGAVLILIGILIAIYGVFQFGDGGYIGIGSVFSGIFTAFGGLVSMAIGELICVLMATEKNTRKIANLLNDK